MTKRINPSDPLEVSEWVKKRQAEMKRRQKKEDEKLPYPRNIEKRVKDWGWLDEK